MKPVCPVSLPSTEAYRSRFNGERDRAWER